MVKAAKGMFEVVCPCCEATLKIDPETRAVISHQEKERPRTFESIEAGVTHVQGEAAKREEIFQKSVADHKVHKEVLARKFDELFKQAKEKPDAGPRLRDVDLD
jgi:hypothetical protein